MSKIRSHILRILLVVAMMIPMTCLDMHAQDEVVDENFVITSLLVSEPGGALYSRLGHVAIRMQCPEHDLDYVFSYSTEDILDSPFTFLSGKLKNGVVAIKPEDYIEDYRKQGRGMQEYILNIPIEAKRNLWRILDNHILEGLNQNYDYLSRGCAHGSLMLLKEGLAETGLKLEYGAWPEHFQNASRREITYRHLKRFKWTTFILHLICNGAIDDTKCSNEQKTIIPADLPYVLANATINGVKVICDGPVEILPNTWHPRNGIPTPMMVAAILLLLTIICSIKQITAMDYVLLGIQTVFGAVTTYLVLFSSLVCTEWSWLLIPFNPLPLILWKWRRKWYLPYAVIIVVWAGFMILWPHLLTDNAYIAAALCLATSYIINYKKSALKHE